MKHFRVEAVVRILATRTYFVEATSAEDAKRLPFDEGEISFIDFPVETVSTEEEEVNLVEIKSVEQIS